jgi:hypothetical protein
MTVEFAQRQNKFWNEVSEEEDPLEGRGIDGMMKCGRTPPSCSIRETGAQRQGINVTEGRKQGRPWPQNGLKSHRKRRRRRRRRNKNKSQSRWSRGQMFKPVAPCLLGFRVRIPLGAWVCVCCKCYVFSGIGLGGGPIPRPEVSYRAVQRERERVCVCVCVCVCHWMLSDATVTSYTYRK